MNSIDTWPPWLALVIAGGWALFVVAGFVYCVYLSHCHLNALKDALKNSRYIYLWGPCLGRRGWIWSVMEITKITAMIMMPKTHIRLGDLDSSDYAIFPGGLKRLLIVDFTLMIFSLVWMIIAAVLIKFG
jgi:hypothetical protein